MGKRRRMGFRADRDPSILRLSYLDICFTYWLLLLLLPLQLMMTIRYDFV